MQIKTVLCRSQVIQMHIKNWPLKQRKCATLGTVSILTVSLPDVDLILSS